MYICNTTVSPFYDANPKAVTATVLSPFGTEVGKINGTVPVTEERSKRSENNQKKVLNDENELENT